jgi:hypothetical protein
VISGTSWLLPIPIAWTNKSPQNISLKSLIDMLTYLFTCSCVGCGLDSGCGPLTKVSTYN